MALVLNKSLDELKLSGIRRFAAMAKETPGCISLTLGEPDADTSDEVKAEVAADLAAGFTHYPPNNGYDFLRNALSKHMALFGKHYEPHEIIVTCGATEALFVALTSVLNPGDEVIVPTPAFTLYESIITLNRATPVLMDTSDALFQITDEMLESVASQRTKAIVITSPNNPTGCILSEESLAAVARFAKKHDVFVVCDDVYGQLVYEEGYKSFAVEHPQLRDRVIVCDSFSKPYAMTGWRLGWVAADESLLSQMAKVHQYMVSSVPAFVQHAAVRALEESVAPARGVYSERRDVVLRRLDEMGLETVRPAGAFYAFPSIREFGMSSEEFCTRLIKEARVALVPGVFFGAEGFVRLSYCCSMEDIVQGLDRLEGFVSGLRA